MVVSNNKYKDRDRGGYNLLNRWTALFLLRRIMVLSRKQRFNNRLDKTRGCSSNSSRCKLNSSSSNNSSINRNLRIWLLRSDLPSNSNHNSSFSSSHKQTVPLRPTDHLSDLDVKVMKSIAVPCLLPTCRLLRPIPPTESFLLPMPRMASTLVSSAQDLHHLVCARRIVIPILAVLSLPQTHSITVDHPLRMAFLLKSDLIRSRALVHLN